MKRYGLPLVVMLIGAGNITSAQPSSQEACLYFAEKHIFQKLELQYPYGSHKNFIIPSVVKLEDRLDRYAVFLWPDILFEAYSRASDKQPSVMGKVSLVCSVDYVERRVLSIKTVLAEKSYDKYELESGNQLRIERVKPIQREVGTMVHSGHY